MIGPLGRLGAAATLEQHCPQMTQRRCIGAAGKIFARILMLLKGPIVQMNGVLADFSLAECSLAVEQIPDSWLSHNNFHYISFCYISFLCFIILQFSGQSSSDTALICRECFI